MQFGGLRGQPQLYSSIDKPSASRPRPGCLQRRDRRPRVSSRQRTCLTASKATQACDFKDQERIAPSEADAVRPTKAMQPLRHKAKNRRRSSSSNATVPQPPRPGAAVYRVAAKGGVRIAVRSSDRGRRLGRSWPKHAAGARPRTGYRRSATLGLGQSQGEIRFHALGPALHRI